MTQLELNKKKGVFRYIGQKRKMKETVATLMNKTEELATTSMEKAEILDKFLPRVQATSPNSQNPKADTGRMKHIGFMRAFFLCLNHEEGKYFCLETLVKVFII